MKKLLRAGPPSKSERIFAKSKSAVGSGVGDGLPGWGAAVCDGKV